MTGRYDGGCCPGCGSYQVTPYCFVVGVREVYGYHCPACQITWRVLVYDGTAFAASSRNPAR